MKNTVSALFLSLSLLWGTTPLIPDGYQMPLEEEKIVFFDDFSQGTSQWSETHPGIYKAVPGAGQNGRIGLVAVRDNPDIHPKLIRPFKGIAGKRYQATLHIKANNLQQVLKEGKSPEILRIHPFFFDHFAAEGKYLSGNYSGVRLATGKETDWTEVSIEFVYPAKADHSRLSLGGYIPMDAGTLTGILSYADMEIKLLGDTATQIYPVYPTQLQLDHSGRLTIQIHDSQNRPESRLLLRALFDDQEALAPIKDSRATISVGKQPVGRHEIRFQLLDTETKFIVGTQSYTFTVPAPGEELFPGCARVDDKGRLLVDGKPFAVRLTSTSSRLTPLDIERIRAAGFNAILPYLSPLLTLDEGDTQPRTIQRLKRALDYLHAHGIKVIFCMKEQVQKGLAEFDGVQGKFEICEHIVSHFKHHPAILCWYISDENPLREIPRIIELRQRLSTIDPFHPILTCTDNPQNQYHFAQTGDIMNPDCYPIRIRTSNTMSPIRPHVLANTGLPVWFTVQAFNWGAFQAGDSSAFRYPTEEEMRSMGLLALNCGSRGISYYSYASVFIRQEKKYPGSASWFWPQVTSVIHLLRELEPYFNAETPSVSLETASTGENFIEAKLHRADNHACVIITADGPGEATATFRLPQGLDLKSRFGRTVQNPDGSYTFTANGICSDILAE